MTGLDLPAPAPTAAADVEEAAAKGNTLKIGQISNQ